jgi:microcystin-dependent protein
MAQPYIGEIRMIASSYNPVGWEFCDGQLLSISENESLFQLIGTTYGGDGQSNFALPNLQSRVPIHQGNGFILAETGGAEEVTLTTQQIPAHSHPFLASQIDGTQNNPGNQVLAQTPVGITMLFEDNPSVNMSANAITPVGGSQPHSNMQPFLAINYIISLYGIFPSPT